MSISTRSTSEDLTARSPETCAQPLTSTILELLRGGGRCSDRELGAEGDRELRALGSGGHVTHLAAQHVDQLGQLVDARCGGGSVHRRAAVRVLHAPRRAPDWAAVRTRRPRRGEVHIEAEQSISKTCPSWPMRRWRNSNRAPRDTLRLHRDGSHHRVEPTSASTATSSACTGRGTAQPSGSSAAGYRAPGGADPVEGDAVVHRLEQARHQRDLEAGEPRALAREAKQPSGRARGVKAKMTCWADLALARPRRLAGAPSTGSDCAERR